MKAWNIEDIDTIAENWKVLSVREIADLLGESRDDVLAVAGRLGLKMTRSKVSRRRRNLKPIAQEVLALEG